MTNNCATRRELTYVSERVNFSMLEFKNHLGYNTELFVCFGGVPLKNGQIAQGGTGSHNQKEKLISSAKAGIKFINFT